MSISDISLVFLNYSLGIGLHTCLFKFDKRADSKQSAQKECTLQYARTSLIVNMFYVKYIANSIISSFIHFLHTINLVISQDLVEIPSTFLSRLVQCLFSHAVRGRVLLAVVANFRI